MLPFVSVMGHTVPVYGALGILGFLLGMLFILLAAPRFGLKRDDAAYIYVFAALGGLAGAKLLYILTALPELAELIRAGAGAQELMGYVSGGLVFFGGVFGALPAAYLSARAYRVKLADFLPVLVPCTAVIGCLGRVGCFYAGCCYGVESGSCLAVVYPEGSLGAPAGVPLLPVQLFEAAWQLTIFLLLLWFTSRPARARFAAEFYILLYSPVRFALEFLRGDAERGFLFGLSTSQWLALVSFLGASLCIFMRLRAKKPD